MFRRWGHNCLRVLIKLTGTQNKQLIKAAKDGNLVEVEHLLTEGEADVNAKDTNGETALDKAVFYEHAGVAAALLKQGANIARHTNCGTQRSIVEWAVFLNDYDLLVAALEAGGDPNEKDSYTQSPLHRCAASSQIPFVVKLLEHGANIEATDKHGERPVHKATWSVQTDVMSVLLRNGANPDSRTGKGLGSETPLHLACRRGKNALVLVLLEHGADIEAKNKHGSTPLHTACQHGESEIATELVRQGANINAPEEDGELRYCLLPIHWAAKNGLEDVVRYFLQKGAHINATDRNGETPLHWAVKRGHLQIVKDLLLNKADTTCFNQFHKTALDLAKSGPDNDEIVKVLQGAM